MSYNVGQIVYLLSKKDLKVFPAQVIEEIKRKTLDGETISYVVMLPDKGRSEALLDELNVESFTSMETVRDKMIDNAKSQITSILGRAEEISSMFVTNSVVANEIDIAQNISLADSNSEDNVLKIDLGNGQTGRVNISEMD